MIASQSWVSSGFQAIDTGLPSLLSADGSAGLPYVSGANAWTSLVLAADKAIYATGTGALSTYTVTAFGRTLGGSADAAAALSTLGAVPTTRSLSVSAPLTGGGDLSASRSFGLSYSTGLTLSGSSLVVDTSVIEIGRAHV